MDSRDENIRRAWTSAVLEQRWATAAYLEPDLPAVDIDESVVRVPKDKRDSFTAKGEIK